MNSDDRIDRSLDGQLSEEEWESLQRDLLSDPELLQSYVEQRWLHARLQVDREALGSLAIEDTSSHVKAGRSAFAGWAAAAAAVALLAIASIFLLPSRAPKAVATLIEAEGCRWEGSDLPTIEGAKLTPGVLALAEGMATIRFDSGATVTLEAPTVLQVDSAMRCRLLEGSVVADVPDSAHGFTIDTDKMEVIDLGTRFGVTNTPVGGSHVFVFEGEVKVREEDAEAATHILTGKSLHFGIAPGSPDQEITRSDATLEPTSGWKQISTARGEGKDAYLRRENGSGQTGGDPLLMVKHTELAPGNERRALLTFDLSELDRSRLSSAKLALKVESSGLGFSSLVPDSKFAVYGVLDPAIHEWSEDGILWEDDSIFTQPELNPGAFVRLAEFTIQKGNSNPLIEIESEPLSSFLLKVPEPHVTLVLVRETGEFDKQGLVHAFASKEHPVGPAPTLWFRNSSDK
jgi:ferric-dicitrate binding protein FerR (iron transport regulator)